LGTPIPHLNGSIWGEGGMAASYLTALRERSLLLRVFRYSKSMSTRRIMSCEEFLERFGLQPSYKDDFEAGFEYYSRLRSWYRAFAEDEARLFTEIVALDTDPLGR
jgi:hypothetical protein